MEESQSYLKNNLKSTYTISIMAGVLMAVVSLAGLLFQESLYPSYELRNAFLVNEMVNLIIGLPILMTSIWFAWRGNLAGLLLLPGALLYILYNYIAYLIGVPAGVLSLVYLAIVILSAYAIYDLLRRIDHKALQGHLSGAVPLRLSGWVLVILGALFIFRALGMLVQATMNQVGLPMSEIGVLVSDLILSAAWVAGGVLLLRRTPLGFTSGLGLLFSGSALFIALILFLLLRPLLTGAEFPYTDVLVVFIMGMACFIPFFLYLRGVLASGRKHDTI
jgi:hypothetical protein